MSVRRSKSRGGWIASILCVLVLLPSRVLANDGDAEAPPTHGTTSSPAETLSAFHAPAVGDVIFDDPLNEPGRLKPQSCPTGRVIGEFVGEGYIYKVRGVCRDGQPQAGLAPTIPELAFTDGEIRLEARFVTGAARARTESPSISKAVR